MTALLLQFLASAAVIVAAGFALSQFGDVIAKKTKMGGMLVGGLLLAAATSLPELTVDIKAIRLGSPDLAIGDLMGSSLCNLLILAVFDLTRYSHGRMLSPASAAHAIAACVSIAVTAVAAIFIFLGPRLENAVFLRIGPGPVLLLVYAVGFRLIAHSRAQSTKQEAPKKAHAVPFLGVVSLRAACVGFAIAAGCILIAGPFLATAADGIAEETGLGGTFFGSTAVALCTSLPEIATTFAALRLGALEMALGNLLGSNSMNMALFFFLDLADSGSLFAAAAPAHAYSALCVMLVTAVVVLGQLYRVERKKPVLEPDAWTAILLILGAFTGLYFIKE